MNRWITAACLLAMMIPLACKKNDSPRPADAKSEALPSIIAVEYDPSLTADQKQVARRTDAGAAAPVETAAPAPAAPAAPTAPAEPERRPSIFDNAPAAPSGPATSAPAPAPDAQSQPAPAPAPDAPTQPAPAPTDAATTPAAAQPPATTPAGGDSE